MIRSRTCRSMKTAAVAAALISLAVAAAPAAAQIGGLPRTGGEWLGKRPGSWTAPATPMAAAKRRAAAPAAPAALTPCEEDPTFQCTTVPVPLDRRHPDGRMVNIHAEVFPHTGPGEAEGAVFVTCGGPGCSITSGPKYGFAFFVLPQIAETRDLVFVDQRGVGLSDPIDCPGLQAGAADSLYEDTAACHDQLGDASDLYSTTDVADDLDDVRRALGYGRIDLFGGSYAGADMMTYAVRHTKRVRSVVLASPAVVVGVDPFYAYAPKAMTAIAGKLCGRSPACRAANPDPERAFAKVARDLRRHPVRGTGVDSGGETHDGVNVTENLLANMIMYFDGGALHGAGRDHPGDGRRTRWRHGAAAAPGGRHRSRARLRQRPARVLRRPRQRARLRRERAPVRPERPAVDPRGASSRARTRGSPGSTVTSPSRPGRIPATSASSRRPASSGAGRSAPSIRRAPASRASRRSCSAVSTTCLSLRRRRSSPCA